MNLLGVATEQGNIGLNPLECSNLVLKRQINGLLVLSCIEP